MNKANFIQLIKKTIQIVDEMYLNCRLKVGTDRMGLCGLLFHSVFENDNETNCNHILPQQRLTVDQYRLIFEYFLENDYKFLSYADLSTPLEPRRKYVYVTFDDGYFNNLRIVPVIEQLNIPIHIFVVTKNILYNKKFWWDVVYNMQIQSGSSKAEIEGELISLKKKSPGQINRYIKEKFGSTAFNPLSDLDRPLSPEELYKLSRNSLVTIGNHTRNHLILTTSLEAEIRIEIMEAQREIEEIICSIPTASFAFPNGDYRLSDVSLLMSLGFDVGFSSETRLNMVPHDLENTRKLVLGRYCFSGNTDLRWQGKICRAGGSPYLIGQRIRAKLMT